MTHTEIIELIRECAERNNWYVYCPEGYDAYGQGATLVLSDQRNQGYTLVDLQRDVLTPFAADIRQAGVNPVLRHDDTDGHCVMRVFIAQSRNVRRDYTLDEIENRPIE
ncbi:MAG: hypothetical protein BWY65_01677 [Firmicutes bacterium ADurb.Bin373]|nr:MAG: hypothetical protein BWY65_01677 [Firmicutes bacterium ADurb.Bin373]